MLIRSTWTLTTAETILLPRSYSLALSKQLHEQMGLQFSGAVIPPVSFSGIVGNSPPTGDFFEFSSEQTYQLSLAGLETEASQAIAALNLGNELRFLGVQFQVTNREDKITNYEQLYSTLVAQEPEPVRNFQLEFLSPTSFSQNRIYLPLPVPTLLFRSWLEKWNHFSHIYLGGEELIDYLSNNTYLRYHQLHTRTFSVKQSSLTGFIGKIRLQVPQRVDGLLANVANLLVNYASFSGTGMKTRLGMGYTINREPNS